MQINLCTFSAGVMKFRNMDEIELVEFTLILRAQDPSHFCKSVLQIQVLLGFCAYLQGNIVKPK